MAETAEQRNVQADDGDEIITVALSPMAWARVTILIASAVSILLVICVLIAGSGFSIFQRKVILRTFLPDATGITAKDKVEIDGIPVGRVKSVTLSGSNEPSRVTSVELLVQQKYLSSIPVDSRVEVTADNLLGDKYINIRKGVGHENVKAGDELLVQPTNVNFNPADLVESLQTVLKRANVMLDMIDDPNSALGQLVQGEAVYDQLRTYIIGIQRTVYSYGNPKSPLGKALFGTELYDQLRAPILDLDKLLERIQGGEGPIGHALVSSEQYDRIRDQIAGYHKSAVELRKNRYLSSDEDYRNMQKAIESLSAMVESVTGQPMLTNAQLYESLNGQAGSARKFLSEFRQNPRKFLRIKVF